MMSDRIRRRGKHGRSPEAWDRICAEIADAAEPASIAAHRLGVTPEAVGAQMRAHGYVAVPAAFTVWNRKAE